MPGSQLREKMFKCLGQGHKNKENRLAHAEYGQAVEVGGICA